MSNQFSDISVSNLRDISVVSRDKQYSDLDLSMQLYPIVRRLIRQEILSDGKIIVLEDQELGDIVPLFDIDAVKASVKNLILTNYNERPFQPKIGSNLINYLFEPVNRLTVVAIQESIKRIIQRSEPRVDSVIVDVIDDSDRNRYNVTIYFRIINIDTEVDFTIYLTRIR